MISLKTHWIETDIVKYIAYVFILYGEAALFQKPANLVKLTIYTTLVRRLLSLLKRSPKLISQNNQAIVFSALNILRRELTLGQP